MSVKIYSQADIPKFTDGADGAAIAEPFDLQAYYTNLYARWRGDEAYDAADGGGNLIASSATIYSYKDLSLNGRHLNQATAGSRLTWTASQLNGHPAGVAGATQKFMNKTGLNSNFPFTFIGVMKLVAHSGSLVLFSLTATNANNYMFECTGTSPRVQLRHSSYSGFYSDSMTLGSYHLVFLCYNGASSILKIDDNSNVTGTMGSGESLGYIQLGYDGTWTANRDFVDGWLYQEALDPASGGGLTQRRYFDGRYWNGSLGI
ncbi:MAG: hypothetical protein HZA50_11580 [Planctomycetes bacterium]|nr:hypothetical protein [Planctomycetota bacterium]